MFKRVKPVDDNGAWQQLLDDSIKQANEHREIAEKTYRGEAEFWWASIPAIAAKNREKEDRMTRIEAKLDELLSLARGGRHD